MAKQLEFEEIGGRTPLGLTCIEYLNLLNKKENLDKEITVLKDKIIVEMRGMVKKTIRIENFLITLRHSESNNINVKIKEKE